MLAESNHRAAAVAETSRAVRSLQTSIRSDLSLGLADTRIGDMLFMSRNAAIQVDDGQSRRFVVHFPSSLCQATRCSSPKAYRR